MGRNIGVLLILVVAMAAASPGNAAMVFSVDAGQDGRADPYWPLADDEAVTMDIRVSNIAAPGLGSMGFVLTYDESLLSVTEAEVDTANWPSAGFPTADHASVSGLVLFLGNRIPEVTGISGNNIRLGTVTFQRIGEGAATLTLKDRDPAQDDFVTLDDPFQVLDNDIGIGVPLITLQSPKAGDVNADGIVDLSDAVLTLQVQSAAAGGRGFKTADVSGDGVIGVAEAIWILRKVAEAR